MDRVPVRLAPPVEQLLSRQDRERCGLRPVVDALSAFLGWLPVLMVNDQHTLADRLAGPGRTRGQAARCLSRSPISDFPALPVADFTSIRQLFPALVASRSADLVPPSSTSRSHTANSAAARTRVTASTSSRPVPYNSPSLITSASASAMRSFSLRRLFSRAYRSPRSARAWRALASASVWRSGSQYAAERARRNASADTRESGGRDVSCVA